MSEVSAKLDRPYERDLRSFLVSKEFINTLAMQALNTTLNVVQAKEKLLNFRCCELVIVPNSKVCRGRGAFVVGGNFDNVVLFRDHMHGQHAFKDL